MNTKTSKRMAATLMALATASISAPIAAQAAIAGEGTAESPYVISTAAELAEFAEKVDGGTSYEGQYVVLGDDIDISGSNWNPIGAEASTGLNAAPNIFNGTFDGQGHTIKGLTIKGNYTDNYISVGLFSGLNKAAVVKNVDLQDVDIDVTSTKVIRAGGLSGWTVSSTNAEGVIGTIVDSCSVQGSVSVSSSGASLVYGAGIVAHANISTAITNCWSDVDVTSVSTGGNNSAYAGGIIAMSGNNAMIINCAAFGDSYGSSPVSTNFGGMAGGISAMFAGKQWNTYAMGNATAGNGGNAAHKWAGAVHGEITTSGMTKNGSDYIYPAKGAIRDYSYYADDITLTIEKWSNAQTKASETTAELAAAGSSTAISTWDHLYNASENVKALSRSYMQSKAFADDLNANIPAVEQLMEAYQIADRLALNEWNLIDGRVIPASAAETATNEAVTEAQPVMSEDIKDGSKAYAADVAISGSATLSGAVWRVWNDDGKYVDINARCDETTITDGTIQVGLVLTENAIGDNVITKAEFVY